MHYSRSSCRCAWPARCSKWDQGARWGLRRLLRRANHISAPPSGSRVPTYDGPTARSKYQMGTGGQNGTKKYLRTISPQVHYIPVQNGTWYVRGTGIILLSRFPSACYVCHYVLQPPPFCSSDHRGHAPGTPPPPSPNLHSYHGRRYRRSVSLADTFSR